MRIAVVSPLHRSGISTVTALLSLMFTWTQKVKTVTTYFGDSDIPRFNGVDPEPDLTRSISQLAKLLQEHAIEPDLIFDYCLPLMKDNYLLDTDSGAITLQERADILKFVFDQVPAEFIICDVNGELGDETTTSILDLADIIIMVVEQYTQQYDEVKIYRESKYWPKDKTILYLCNMFDDKVGNLRAVSANLGVKHTTMCKIHYNPWIRKMCEAGTILDLVKAIVTRDTRVIELNTDLKECIGFICNTEGIKYRWE